MPRLTLVDGRSPEMVELPRGIVVNAAVDAQVLAIETDRDLARLTEIVSTLRGENRIRALLAITELRVRVRATRPRFHVFAGIVESAPPTQPADEMAAVA